MDNTVQFISAGDLAKQLGITRRTLGRRIVDVELGLPRPVEIKKRLYFIKSEVEIWKQQHLARAVARSA